MLGKLKPQSRREWFKLAWDIFLVIFFVCMIFMVSTAFREGFDAGMAKCMGNFTNFTNNINWSDFNFT